MAVLANVQRTLLSRQGFCVLPGYVSSPAIAHFLATLQTTSTTHWQAGDDSPHAWRELRLRQLDDLSDLVEMADLTEILDSKIRTSAAWVNVYSEAQFIPAHHDAAGDAQLLLVLQTPTFEQGGQFWVGNEANLMPIGPGDGLLFRANRMLHGTTRIKSGCGAIRTTLNVRLWLEGNICRA